MKNNGIKIEELRLKNFQSIREETSIRFGKINFLYGPNSAGKSSMHDALSLIKSVLNGDRKDMIERWQSHSSIKVNEEMRIGITFLARLSNYLSVQSLSIPSEFLKGDDFINKLINLVRYDLDFILGANTEEEVMNASLSIDGLPIFIVKHNDDGCWDLVVYPNSFGKEMLEFLNRHLESIEDDGTISIKCWLNDSPLRLDSWSRGGFGDEAFEIELLGLVNTIIENISYLEFNNKKIDGDRGLIADHELSSAFSVVTDGNYFFNYIDGLSLGWPEIPLRSLQSLENLSSGIYGDLLRSVAKKWFESEREKFKQLESNEDGDAVQEAVEVLFGDDDSQKLEKESIHEFVNRCFADHLFLDNGYQVSTEVFEVLRPSLEGSDGSQSKISQVSTKKKLLLNVIVVSWLIDSSGGRLTFSDVGSGLSCVVPVLIGLASGNCFIQQPELHLHPSLQSALGDIFLESSSMGLNSLQIIETHSEYPLLRCLKRIRESSAGKIEKSNPLYISHSDIKIHYFEPIGNGETKIKTIRVGPNGDFIDRWPRGFFAERSMELFDE